MENSFPYTLDNKRYHTFNYYLKNRYDAKVAKVMIDGHFTCPNRDGSKGYGGCIFCSGKGSGDANTSIREDILTQYENNKKVMNRKWPNELYIPYFQSFTNTYGPLDKIKGMLEPFTEMDEVAEIAVATRCDCLEEETVRYLDSLCDKKPVWLELGLQTSNDKTGEFLNRCYSFEDFRKAIDRLSKTRIKVCVHVINGLPYETREDMLKTIRDINHLKFDAIKIHMLHIIKDTKLAEIYEKDPFPVLNREEYIEITVRQLELLKPEIIIERLTGDPLKDELIGPEWLLNKTTILNDIDKLMVKEDTYQGSRYAD
ncbi:MAG: TIGR01212 family radical SAM protein [Erysipelotrichaceae bacterium]|nr:TIGR01212 family radical SAM protein [Erysipelotrichaceae bacterium]